MDGKPLSSQGPLGRNEARFASRWILAAISARALIGLRPPLGVFQEVRDQAPSQQVEVALAGLRMPAHDHRILAGGHVVVGLKAGAYGRRCESSAGSARAGRRLAYRPHISRERRHWPSPFVLAFHLQGPRTWRDRRLRFAVASATA